MLNIRSLFFSAIVLISVNVWSEEFTSIGEAGTFGVGFDEGLLSRVYILDNIAAYGGFGYYVFGADSSGMQPINKISWKLGGEYLFMVYGRLHVSAFTEWREECYQGQTAIGPGGSTFRYNQWNTLFRGGIRPELFLLKNLSIDFKMGLAYIHHGPTRKINADGSGTESRKNSYDEFGVYYGRAPFLSTDQHILLNIGVTFYFTKRKSVRNSDSDGDGIADRLDKCPNKAGLSELDGCPKAREITRGQLVLKDVNFESGEATLLPASYVVLDEIAESFRQWPEVKVEVQGHTDNIGTPESNKILSQRRAETVREYLIQKGIAPDRITAVGYGQEKPVADNATPEGRAQNRRVELNRID